MLDRTKHEITMRNILNDIYSNHNLSNKLGFKGGTSCYFFYDLPRFSTDLDFNLLSTKEKEMVFSDMKTLLEKYGEVRDQHKKANTLFYYLVHTPQKSGIKIEISTREIEKVNSYDILEFYGTAFLVMKKEDIFANKLLALTYRHAASARDLFDINFFFSKGWSINKDIIIAIAKMPFIEYMETLPKYIKENFNTKNIHVGLGELLNDQSQRDFVKRKLIEDTVRRISTYLDSIRRAEGLSNN